MRNRIINTICSPSNETACILKTILTVSTAAYYRINIECSLQRTLFKRLAISHRAAIKFIEQVRAMNLFMAYRVQGQVILHILLGG